MQPGTIIVHEIVSAYRYVDPLRLSDCYKHQRRELPLAVHLPRLGGGHLLVGVMQIDRLVVAARERHDYTRHLLCRRPQTPGTFAG